MAYYSIDIYNHGEISIAVVGEYDTDAEAIHWCYFWLGRHRGESAKLIRADDPIAFEMEEYPGKIDLCEVKAPDYLQHYPFTQK